jgi:putative ABC transport system permease protein
VRIADYIHHSFANLWKKRLRTSLTVFGIAIGIGSLFCMFAFGKGIQKNITDQFEQLELFNYVTIYPGSPKAAGEINDANDVNDLPRPAVLDDEFIARVLELDAVTAAFPEERFPVELRFNDDKEHTVAQVLSADALKTGMIKLRAGSFYTSEDINCVVISDTKLRGLDLKDPQQALGKEIEIVTVTPDLTALLNPAKLIALANTGEMPITANVYEFTIIGVAEKMGIGGPLPVRSDLLLSPQAADNMKKISTISIWDLFAAPNAQSPYSSVNIKLKSPKHLDAVKATLKQWGYSTFALIDQLEEIKKGFIILDLFLLAIAMIGITVASLGIVNTMVMSILERYREIGIAKAVGASDRDIMKIFFFEAAAIGFVGGLMGLLLGWLVSMIINVVVNLITAEQGVPHIDYFSFPIWLSLGAVTFSVCVSLLAGVYPTLRAARVDPVVALRHD